MELISGEIFCNVYYIKWVVQCQKKKNKKLLMKSFLLNQLNGNDQKNSIDLLRKS